MNGNEPLLNRNLANGYTNFGTRKKTKKSKVYDAVQRTVAAGIHVLLGL